MKSAETKIINRLGLHARAAARLLKLATEFKSDVILSKAGKQANAKRIMDLLMLGAMKGSSITVSAQGPDEDRALNAIVTLINNKFNESE